MQPELIDGLQVEDVNAVVVSILEAHFPTELHILRLGYGGQALNAAIPSRVLADRLLSQPLAVHRFRMLDWMGRMQDPFCIPAVIVQSELLPGLFGMEFAPLSTCPVTGVLPQFLALVREIQAEPLRLFVHAVFEDREVFGRFWTLPASARHHHAHSGGLAEHSVEVAQDIASHAQLTGSERDLGIAGGLLHDIGKVWSYTTDMFPNAACQAMGHELLGLTRLEPHLKALESLWPDGAFAMRALLSGCSRMRSDGTLPSALITRIRAADQRSCERNVGHPARKSRSWIPQAWAGPT